MKTDFDTVQDHRTTPREDCLHSPYDLLGKRVRIATLDGMRVSGRVAEVTPTQVAIEPAAESSSVGGVDRTIKYVDVDMIDTIAFARPTIDSKILAITLGGALASCLILFVVGLSQMQD